MKDQFEVWDYPFPDKGLHPVVLISPPDRCAHSARLNVLVCTSQRQNRRPYPVEVLLDTADGLDWESFCDCSILWVAESAKLTRKRGKVSLNRRLQIRSLLKELFLLNSTD